MVTNLGIRRKYEKGAYRPQSRLKRLMERTYAPRLLFKLRSPYGKQQHFSRNLVCDPLTY